MNTIKKLFELIKEHQYDEFEKLLINNKPLNVNLKDEQNNYLITYSINYNNYKITELLIDNGAHIDVSDVDGRSIIYYPIKFNYIKIVELLLNRNTNNIGLSIHDIKDKSGNIPIHYSIIYKNLQALKLLLDYGSNPNITNNYGNNSLHLAVYSRKYDIVESILKHNINVNIQNNNGDTAIHLTSDLQELEMMKLLLKQPNININIQDTNNEFTPLHSSIKNNNINQVKILLEHNANPNLQDIYGNCPLHLVILENNLQIMDIILNQHSKDYNLNYNLWNIHGKLPLHLVFEINTDSIEYYLDLLLEKTNINRPDNNGSTCFLYICKSSLWKKYKKILINKKLDINVMNNRNEKPIDFIDENDMDEFVDMITKSYLSRLKNSKTIWSEEWQNICNKELLVEHLDPKQKKKFQDMNILDANIKENQDICYQIVKKRIIDLVNDKNNINRCSYKSYPLKQGSICININDSNTINMCTFTGSTLDILIGLIYLLKKHPDACSTVNQNFSNNEKLCNFYRSINISLDSRCEFMNFEIVWAYGKLYFSDDFEDEFIKCYNDPSVRFIIIPLGIEIKKGNHANYLIYDKNVNEIERFEPHGSSTTVGFNYDPESLDKNLSNKFMVINNNIKYIKPSDYLPKIGFQIMDSIDRKNRKIGDPGGFCALWAIWYTDMRLTYKDVKRDKLVNIMLDQMKSTRISFKNLIRNYSKQIIDIRDVYFDKIKIDINDWINDKISDEDIKTLIKLIQNDLTS